jgi:ABC-type phosphate transport system substrate-binding protein
MKKIDVVGKFMMLALVAAVLAGCGSGSPAPGGASIVIAPEKLDTVATTSTTPVTGTPSCADNWSNDPITITIIGSNGKAVQYVDVNYSLTWTAETSDYDVQRLYSGGLQISGSSAVASATLPSGPLRTDISGNIYLIIATDISCAHTTVLSVQSGSSYAQFTIDVAAPAAVVP